MLDAVVVGGGLIGLSSALELARRGLSVCVVDRGDEGARASWAAAGILGPQSEVHDPSPMLELCRLSFGMYEHFVQNLGDVGFRRCGTLHLAFGAEQERALDAQRRWQEAAGLRIEERKHDRARLALFFPDEGQVDNRRLLEALRAACLRAGVEIRRGEAAVLEAGRVILKRADIEAGAAGAEIAARSVVLCAGSWSGQLAPVAVHPVRGQALLLDAPPPDCIVFGGGGYAVPRGGRTLIGATAEKVGFDASPTEQGRAYLLGVAKNLIPGSHPVLDHWAGLRPGTPDARPLLGRLSSGIVVATGHYRNGVLLAPISARIVSALVRGELPPVDLAPFDPARYGPGENNQ